jgi:hypothetical protein
MKTVKTMIFFATVLAAVSKSPDICAQATYPAIPFRSMP